MMKKLLFVFMLSLVNSISFAQVVITEIYYDTPYNECANCELYDPTKIHHLGEYIELYNYSTEDISLKGWALTDLVSRYDFPANAIIKSQSFIVVAYRKNTTNNYFTTFFPTTQGKETQIFYQDRIMLKNRGDEVRLHMGTVRGLNLKSYTLHSLSFGDMFGSVPINYSIETETPSSYNFYTESVHYNGSTTYPYTTKSTATPLLSDYVPQTQDMKNIPQVQNAMLSNLINYTWDYFSDAILNTSCPDAISKVEQIPAEIYLPQGKCFSYDASGNYLLSLDCSPSTIPPNTITEYTPAEIEDINSKIILFPNPTYSVINVSWDASLFGKITNMQVASTNGTSIYTTSISSTQNTASINLTSQPTGIYIVKFILNTGQFISKNVIKI
jgi:hypothetical protein